jgi:hypothetical protein
MVGLHACAYGVEVVTTSRIVGAQPTQFCTGRPTSQPNAVKEDAHLLQVLVRTAKKLKLGRVTRHVDLPESDRTSAIVLVSNNARRPPRFLVNNRCVNPRVQFVLLCVSQDPLSVLLRPFFRDGRIGLADGQDQ